MSDGRVTRRALLKRAVQTAMVAGGAGAAARLEGWGARSEVRSASRERGAWPCYRGDLRLTGRASLPADMAEAPAVVWQHRIEAGQAWAVVDPGQGRRSSQASVGRGSLPGNYLDSAEGKRWGLGPKLVDLCGDGRLVPDPGRAAKLLPDVPGLQTVAFLPAPDVSGLDPKRAICYAYDTGQPREVWRSDALDTIQNTNFAIADVDNDGRLEVVLAPHYRLIVYDGQTGRTKHVLRIHNYRNYGFFCCKDLTGDGLLDFVIIADFAMHVDVIRNEGDRLRLLWRRDIELDIQSKHRIIHPGPNPVLDINGDGRVEILVNLFNEKGDGRWHVVAYDALTGDTLLDLPESYVHGSADLNGDGVPELCVARTTGLYVPESSELRLLRVRGSRAEVLWERGGGRWVTEPQPLPLTHSTIVANGTHDVVTARLSDGRRGFFLVERGKRGEEACLCCAVDTQGRVAEEWRLGLPTRARLRVRACVDVDGDGADEVLLSYRQPDVAMARIGPCQGAAARVVALEATRVRGEAIGAGELRPVVAGALAGSGRATVVMEGADDDLIAIAPPSRPRSAPRIRWRVPGAGPAVLADVNGDGLLEVICAGAAPTGEGEIAALDGHGKALWRHRVSGFPGPHPPWNLGGVTTWWAGCYTERERCDVWVSARRSTMHSDEAWVLRGTDGREVWHVREVRTNATPQGSRGWGAGGSFVCSADVDGDGLDDVIGLYPVNYMAAQGKSGALIHSVEAASGLFEGVWGAYCQPIVADLNGDGRDEILWCGPYHHGLTTLEARVLWYHKGGASAAGVGDVDGDGRLELGFTGREGGNGLCCLDAATGALRWEWPIAGNPRVAVLTADVNGDGRDEFLFAVGTTLYAVGGDGGAPRVAWQASLPSPPGALALADVDGDSRVEILFVGTDSTLYCLDRAP